MIQVSDSEDELDRTSSIRSSKFIVTRITDNLKEEEEMSLERKRGLRELLVGRAKGLAPKDASGSQLRPPSPSPLLVKPFVPANLKKRKKDKEVGRGGVGPSR